MGDWREHQSNRRKQTVDYWERPKAKSGQRTPEEKAMSVQEEQPGAETTGEEDSLDPWQT